MSRKRFLPLAGIGWVLFSGPLSDLEAQSTWLEPRGERGVYLEWLRPSVEGADLTFITSSLYLSTRWTVGGSAAFVAELPYVYAGVDSDFGDLSGSSIGNPYLGIEFGGSDSRVLGELGLRLPLTPEPDNAEDALAVDVGALSDLVDRWEAFLPEVVSVHSAFNYRYRGESGFILRARLSPILWFDTGDALRDETELLVQYSAQAGVDLEHVIFNGGIAGRTLITEPDLDFGERSLYHLVLAGQAKLGAYRPGLQLRLPLDEDYADMVDIVIGLSLGIQVK